MFIYLKKLYWLFSAWIASLRYPINNSLIYLGVTGTDGKTTTSTFLYEIAKSCGYEPFLLTTVSAKFRDEDIDLKLKPSSFFAYSIKNFFKLFKKRDFRNAARNLFFLDKKGFAETLEEHRTTPLAPEIRKVIKEYEKKGANLFILETTSHSLDQYRIFGIKFNSIVFTNITSEHLDYHGSWEKYAGTKSKLINQLKPGGSAVINKDDKKSYEFLMQVLSRHKDVKVCSYLVKDFEKIDPKKFCININDNENDSEAWASPLESQANERNSAIETYQTGIKLFGNYNIYNALGAVACFHNLNPDKIDKIIEGIQNLENITGRMNFLSTNPIVIVDFAHTPNAFEKSLSSAKTLVKKSKARLWVVFGCAGLRDRYKRPAMGKFAYDFADNVLITAEDPRTEVLNNINNEIIEGFAHEKDTFTIQTYYPELRYEPEEGRKFIVRFDEPSINSRKDAIKFAIGNAAKDDVILILGKGHETSMCFGEQEFRWNDIEVVKGLPRVDSGL